MAKNNQPVENYDATKAALKAQMVELARKLDILTQYESLKQEVARINAEMAGSTVETTAPEQARPSDNFASLKKANAAARVILDKGQGLTLPMLFKLMKDRGHPVKNPNALRSMLVREKDEKDTFTNMNALWDLSPKGRATYGS